MMLIIDQENANFLVSCRLLSKVWEEAHLAKNSESYTLNEYEDVAYFMSLHFII